MIRETKLQGQLARSTSVLPNALRTLPVSRAIAIFYMAVFCLELDYRNGRDDAVTSETVSWRHIQHLRWGDAHSILAANSFMRLFTLSFIH